MEKVEFGISAISLPRCRIRHITSKGHIYLDQPDFISNYSFALGFSPAPSVFQIGGKEFFHDPQQPDLVFTGAEPMYSIETSGTHDVLEVVPGETFVHFLADELNVPNLSSSSPRFGEHDPVYWAISAQLRSAARGQIHLSDLAGDRLLLLLLRHVLLKMHSGKSRERGFGGLDSRRMVRVTEYIEANLHRSLSIDNLAEVAALSPFHFLRSFKCATGMTPHKFVNARRMERAKSELLAGSRLYNVVARYGFTEERHFRLLYLRHHGHLPSDLVK